MNIDWGLAGAVILTGMVIVFIILIILIWSVTLVSRIVKSASKKTAAAAPAPAPVVVSAPAPKRSAAPAVQTGIGGETVAAISAAVYSYMDEAAPGVSYAVKSIRRADGERPVWGFAGMRQNTRPF